MEAEKSRPFPFEQRGDLVFRDQSLENRVVGRTLSPTCGIPRRIRTV
jgi:hypothetical protein